MILFDSLFSNLNIMVDYKYIIAFLWLAFSFFWVNKVPLDLFLFFFLPPHPHQFSFTCVSLHILWASQGDRSRLVHVSDLKVVCKCSHILQIGNFAIIKLHEYEDSCRIPRMPHGEDLQWNFFSAHCDLLECQFGSVSTWCLLLWSANHILANF